MRLVVPPVRVLHPTSSKGSVPDRWGFYIPIVHKTGFIEK